MPIECEYSRQARVRIVTGTAVIEDRIAPAPIEYEIEEYSPPWDSRAWFTVCNYLGCNSGWAFDSGGRRYLRAPFTNFRLASGASGYGIFFDQAQNRGNGRSPAPPSNELPITRWYFNYETPAPPPNRWIVRWRSSSVANSDRAFDLNQRPTVTIECSCDERSFLQCGDMGTPNYCCLSCASVNSQFLQLANRISALAESINP